MLFIGVFVIGFLLAIILTGGYYIRVLIGHLFNIYFWIPNRVNRFAHQVRGLQSSNKKKDFVELVYTMLAKFAPFTLIGTNFCKKRRRDTLRKLIKKNGLIMIEEILKPLIKEEKKKHK